MKLFERPDGQLNYEVETGETGCINADGDTRERLFDQYKITEYEIQYGYFCTTPRKGIVQGADEPFVPDRHLG